MNESKIYSIWREGYICTGGSSTASLLDNIKANSFDEAVEIYKEKNPRNTIERVDSYPRSSNWSDWGCRLFDNEKQARETFG